MQWMVKTSPAGLTSIHIFENGEAGRSGERRLPACTSRQLASKNFGVRAELRGRDRGLQQFPITGNNAFQTHSTSY